MAFRVRFVSVLQNPKTKNFIDIGIHTEEAATAGQIGQYFLKLQQDLHKKLLARDDDYTHAFIQYNDGIYTVTKSNPHAVRTIGEGAKAAKRFIRAHTLPSDTPMIIGEPEAS